METRDRYDTTRPSGHSDLHTSAPTRSRDDGAGGMPRRKIRAQDIVRKLKSCPILHTHTHTHTHTNKMHVCTRKARCFLTDCTEMLMKQCESCGEQKVHRAVIDEHGIDATEME